MMKNDGLCEDVMVTKTMNANAMNVCDDISRENCNERRNDIKR